MSLVAGGCRSPLDSPISQAPAGGDAVFGVAGLDDEVGVCQPSVKRGCYSSLSGSINFAIFFLTRSSDRSRISDRDCSTAALIVAS